jgi:hypothetical protein
MEPAWARELAAVRPAAEAARVRVQAMVRVRVRVVTRRERAALRVWTA